MTKGYICTNVRFPCVVLVRGPRIEQGSAGYRIPNGPGTIGGTRHDPKKHDPSPALGTIIGLSAGPARWPFSAWAATSARRAGPKHDPKLGGPIAAR
jgi:hypothetical protein